jgi:plasmid stabilization system protein ParE
LRIAFRRRVGGDLADAYGWYEQQQPGLGEAFLASVDASFDIIGKYPEMFAAVHREVRRALVARFPFAVFYLVEPQRVVVLTVLHTARDPRAWPRPRSKTG